MSQVCTHGSSLADFFAKIKIWAKGGSLHPTSQNATLQTLSSTDRGHVILSFVMAAVEQVWQAKRAVLLAKRKNKRPVCFYRVSNVTLSMISLLRIGPAEVQTFVIYIRWAKCSQAQSRACTYITQRILPTRKKKPLNLRGGESSMSTVCGAWADGTSNRVARANRP